MREVQLTAGTVGYTDIGGDKPVVVLIGGLLIGASLWKEVIERLTGEFRCIVPCLPWGAHLVPMRSDADLSLGGQAKSLAEFLAALDLREVTLVESDTAMAQVLAGDANDRIARMVLCPCETADNIPPGLPGRAVALAARVPGGLWLATRPMRVRALRRSPIAFGWMAKYPIPHEVTDRWLHPILSDREIRRDLSKYLRSVRRSRRTLREATANLALFDRPVLIVWAADDRVMPPRCGRRLAEAFPNCRFVEVADSYTLVPHDQPDALANHIATFAGAPLKAVQR
jgi:pimeloyl-ACP methyl ester carboxylesterase